MLAQMTSMTVVLTLGIGLLIAGLVIVLLSSQNLGSAVLKTVVWWIGIVLAVFGVILIITPVLIWLSGVIHGMLGA